MAGFGECDRVLHRFAGPDLADQDHVRRLAQSILQRDFVGLGVDPTSRWVTMQPVRMHVFERVFDRDDVSAGVVRCDG